MENKNLFERLKRAGKIKDASEAFKEFTPEEEWHKRDANILFKIGRVEKETVDEYKKNLEKLF